MIVHSNAFVFSTSLLAVVSRYGLFCYNITVFPEPSSLIVINLIFAEAKIKFMTREGCNYVIKICSSFEPFGL
jgi:hypothetical protein